MSTILPDRSSNVKPHFQDYDKIPRWRPNQQPIHGKEKPLTIGIGFKFSDGILLCADTQHTYSGLMKAQGTKLYGIASRSETIGKPSRNEETAVFAISGSVPYAKMAVEQSVEAILNLDRLKQDITLELLRKTVHSIINKIYHQDVYKHPRFGWEGGPDFNLLIGLRSHHNMLQLLSTSETAINEIDEYGCIGTGSYIARYIISQLYRPNMTLNEAVGLAVHVLQETKNHAEGCGGKSEFIVMDFSGKISEIGLFEIDQRETFAKRFQDAMRRFFSEIADLNATDQKFIEATRLFELGIKTAREDLSKEKARRESLIEALSKGSSSTMI